MNSATKVGEIFTKAGDSYNKIGDMLVLAIIYQGRETNVRPYEAFTSAAFGKECEAKLVIVSDEDWTFKTHKEVKIQGVSTKCPLASLL